MIKSIASSVAFVGWIPRHYRTSSWFEANSDMPAVLLRPYCEIMCEFAVARLRSGEACLAPTYLARAFFGTLRALFMGA